MQVPPAGADDGLIEPGRRMSSGRLEPIAGDVFLQELVVGNIRIERPDQVVAIPPRVRDAEVLLVPIRLGKADEVHPMACPLLPKAGRLEQAVHHFLKGLGRRIGQERGDLFRLRWEPGEVEGDTANQRWAVGRGRGGEFRLL